jgi:hypothetical protein
VNETPSGPRPEQQPPPSGAGTPSESSTAPEGQGTPPSGGESEHRVLFEHEAHEPTKVDAMGLDKHRQVVGGSYRPSMLRQAARFGIFFAVVGALFYGGKLLADDLDKPPASNPDKAVWSAPDAAQTPIPRYLRQ